MTSINTEERRKSSAVGGAQRRVEYFLERREWRVGRDGEGGRPALVLPAVGPLARVLGALELLGFEPAAVQMAPVRGAAVAAASAASVMVIDCTTTGEPPPIWPSPTRTPVVRWSVAVGMLAVRGETPRRTEYGDAPG